MYYSEFSRKTTNGICVYVERDIWKWLTQLQRLSTLKSTYMLMSSGPRRTDGVVPSLMSRSLKTRVADSAVGWRILSRSGKSVLCSSHDFNWLNEAHRHMENNLRHTQFINVLIASKTPSKFTHKMNHHKPNACQNATHTRVLKSYLISK